MSSIFSGSPLWSGDRSYVTAQADFLHHQIDPAHLDLGTTCLMTCSSNPFRRLLELVPLNNPMKLKRLTQLPVE